MKRYGGVLFMALACACVYFGAIYIRAAPAQAQPRTVVGAELFTRPSRWIVAATFAAAGTAPNDLSDNERTHTTIKAAIAAALNGDEKIVMYNVPLGANAVRFRLAGTAADQQAALVVYSGSKSANADCVYAPRGIQTWTVGSQVSTTGGYCMADTLTVTSDGATTSPWTAASPANNTVAEGLIDLQGDDWLVFVPTTLGCDIQLLIKPY